MAEYAYRVAAPTVGEFLRYLAPSLLDKTTRRSWPPDIFAVAAALLQKCGAYTHVVSSWPPTEYERRPKGWITDIENIGKEWRKNCVENKEAPEEVNKWWKVILENEQLSLSKICEEKIVCEALLQLAAAADKASEGAGIPKEEEQGEEDQEKEQPADLFQVLADFIVTPGHRGSSLCLAVDRSSVRVLPKLHTPQSGMTIRSLSHHLALCAAEDVEVSWYKVAYRAEFQSLNLLLLPWPKVVIPSQFRPVKGPLRNMPKQFGFFTYRQGKPQGDLAERVMSVFERAHQLVGRIDGVILPELALNTDGYQNVQREVLGKDAFLVCGIGEPGEEEQPGKNYLAFDVRLGPGHYLHHVQHKHHRWRLDQRQIIQYGLAGTLDPSRLWWEHISLAIRNLGFFAMRPWLTLCALICEDLARQDPVAEIVRAVGPNLVIAILMDGPQLSSRWPARYATVLADDPGSSVLTLTSLGMTELSRPLHEQKPSRVIAMWKDAKSGAPVQIELPEKAEAVVLSLAVDKIEEWTADGRSDGGATGYPILSGIHPVWKEG